MSRVIYKVVLLSCLFLLTKATWAAILSYEPVVVTLCGTLKAEEFPGPPNYGESPTDSKELVPVLALREAQTVLGNDRELNNKTYRNIVEIQLLSQKKLIKVYDNKDVQVSGRLSEAISGHHHTAIIMNVNSIHLWGQERGYNADKTCGKSKETPIERNMD